MSTQFENAFEVDSLLIGDESQLIGLFAGGVLPHIAVPDAPIYSEYRRTNGDIYKLIAVDGSIAGNWQLQSGNVQLDLELPFYDSTGASDTLPIINFELEFYDSNGVQDNINIT